MTKAESVEVFVVCAPGLEAIVAAELVALGVRGTVEVGGVSFEGTIVDVMRANLWLRAASRVLVRIARFRAASFSELEKRALKVPWSEWLPDGALRLGVSSTKSRLYHTGAIAERLLRAIDRPVAAPLADAPLDESSDGAQAILARFVHDECTLSLDASGELLHRRGYRLAAGKAPLRETLAAALLLCCAWRGGVPLVDPLCGSGTIAIEAALLARRIAPGRQRAFAFSRWPLVDGVAAAGRAWAQLLAEADAGVLSTSPVAIAASDRDAGAVKAAQQNAARAGVAADIVVEERALSDVGRPLPGALLLTNPPYGIRIGDGKKLRDLYAALGRAARERCPRGRLALLTTDGKLASQASPALRPILDTKSGGLSVHLYAGDVI